MQVEYNLCAMQSRSNPYVPRLTVPVTQRLSGDVVRAGLRLLEEHEAKVKALQDALNAGLASGEPRPFDFEAFKARKRAGLQSS